MVTIYMILVSIIFSIWGDLMKFAEGFLLGSMVSLVGCVVFKFMFPEAEEEMCHSIKKISKDMGKDLENMK